MMINLPCRSIVVLCLLSVTTACGFYLRGQQPPGQSTSSDLELAAAPVSTLQADQPIYLEGDASAMLSVLRRYLQDRDYNLTNSPAEAVWRLRLTQEKVDNILLSVDSTTGKGQEYELILSFFWSAYKDGELQIDAERIELGRDYIYSQDVVAANVNERERVLQDIRRTAASRVVRRLQYVGNRPGSE